VVWANGRLSFDHLQKRMARRASRRAPSRPPAGYVAFDVLAQGGEDHRRLPYTTRRARLERLAASWVPPLQLCPSTADRVEALRLYEDCRHRRRRRQIGSRPLLRRPRRLDQGQFCRANERSAIPCVAEPSVPMPCATHVAHRPSPTASVGRCFASPGSAIDAVREGARLARTLQGRVDDMTIGSTSP
jgi:hypothetical protein